MSVLKPCPFCGSTHLHAYYKEIDSKNDLYDPTIRCTKCGVYLRFIDCIDENRHYKTLDDIIRVWNGGVDEP